MIKNKKILAELMEKERVYRDKDSEAGDEEMVSEKSDIEKVMNAHICNVYAFSNSKRCRCSLVAAQIRTI